MGTSLRLGLVSCQDRQIYLSHSSEESWDHFLFQLQKNPKHTHFCCTPGANPSLAPVQAGLTCTARVQGLRVGKNVCWVRKNSEILCQHRLPKINLCSVSDSFSSEDAGSGAVVQSAWLGLDQTSLPKFPWALEALIMCMQHLKMSHDSYHHLLLSFIWGNMFCCIYLLPLK